MTTNSSSFVAKPGDLWMEPRGFYGKNDRSRFDYEAKSTYLVIGRYDSGLKDPENVLWEVLITNEDGSMSFEYYYCDEWQANENFSRLA